MTSSDIRILAIILMLIDHIGAFFFPDQLFFRIIGRLSFPLFAWLIANGFHHTKSSIKYLLRLGILAIISQLPFHLVHIQNTPDFFGLNIFFTLASGLLTLIIFTKNQSIFKKIFFISLICFVSTITNMDYGAFGVLSILIYYLSYGNIKQTLILQLLLWISEFIFVYYGSNGRQLTLNILSIFSLIFIRLYNQKLGLNLKKIFYSFYPLHLTIIYLIKRFFLA